MGSAELASYLGHCKELILPELQRWVPPGGLGEILYDRMLDYPQRTAKAIRPALCMATCGALGGGVEPVLPSAAVLELYHNAFLVHDDIEDGSELRRDEPTLHEKYGVPIAINIGDAMLALALQPLLENTKHIGLGKALRVLQVVAEMSRVSAEGQALELEWIRANRFDLVDDDYFDMVERKTSHYSFVTPLIVGAIVAGAPEEDIALLRSFGRAVGIAFQIQDDILNLTADYGKEPFGDLYEGKHTLILIHLVRSAAPAERARVLEILRKPRRTAREAAVADNVLRLLIAAANDAPERDRAVAEALADRVERTIAASAKTPLDIEFLRALIERYGSIEYARDAARGWAERASAALELLDERFSPGDDSSFLHDLATYVVERSR